MKKQIIFVLMLFLATVSCSKNATSGNDGGGSSDGIADIWNLNSVTIGGGVADPNSLSDVPVKFQLSNDGTGKLWEESFGRLNNGSPFDIIWRTEGSRLFVQIPGEDEGSIPYRLAGDFLTLTFFDSETQEFQYRRQ